MRRLCAICMQPIEATKNPNLGRRTRRKLQHAKVCPSCEEINLKFIPGGR